MNCEQKVKTVYKDAILFRLRTSGYVVYPNSDPFERATLGVGHDAETAWANAWKGINEPCGRCKGTKLTTITINTENGDYDADDQPCPECL